MSMNSFLAQFYGTNGSEQEKTAGQELSHEQKVDMFAKLAADNGIDLSQLSDAKIDELFAETFAKQAGEMPPQFAKKDGDGDGKTDKNNDGEEDDDKKKKEAAEAEFQQTKSAQAQFDHADFMGRIMAHAYVNEMRKIASDVETKTASAKEPATNGAPAPAEVKTASLRDRLLKIASDDKKEGDGDDKKDDGKKDEKKMPPWMKDKEASALDELACEAAIHMLHEYNKTAEQQFDVKIAADRISAVHTLGVKDSVKIAAAENLDQATHIRALEFLEAAGYPVTWGAQAQ